MPRKRGLRLPVDLRVNYPRRGKFVGYAYLRRNGGYRVTLNLNAMLEDVATGFHGYLPWRVWHRSADAIDRFIVFNTYFWDNFHHEFVGHALGHKLKVRGHSCSNRGHLRWLEQNMTDAQMSIWDETNRTDIVEMFADVAKWLQEKFPVKQENHDPTILANFKLLCSSERARIVPIGYSNNPHPHRKLSEWELSVWKRAVAGTFRR